MSSLGRQRATCVRLFVSRVKTISGTIPVKGMRSALNLNINVLLLAVYVYHLFQVDYMFTVSIYSFHKFTLIICKNLFN